jgi:hypothetical protein
MNSNETAVIPLSFQQELTEKNPNLATPQTLTKISAVLAWLLFLNKREVAQDLQ